MSKLPLHDPRGDRGASMARGHTGPRAGAGPILWKRGDGTEYLAWKVRAPSVIEIDADEEVQIGGEGSANFTNDTGTGFLNVGDVVVIVGTTVTTTTTPQYTGPIGVVVAGGDDGDDVLVQTHGYVAQVNTIAAVTAENYGETSTTAGQATENATPRAGSFCQFLESVQNPPALLFGQTYLTGGGTGGGGVPGWFNVKDYGAIGDGVTDDLGSINDAIAAMILAGGGVLYFPGKASYLVSAGLSAITVPCLVLGEGRGSPSGASANTEIVCSSATATLFDIQDHVHFRDIQLRSSHATPTAGALVALTVAGTDAISFSGCLFRGGWIGLDIQEGGGQSIHDNWFVGQRKYSLKIRNISSPDGGDHAISNCWFYAYDAVTADAAIRFESAGGAKITNCKINNLNGSGSYVNGIDVAPAATTSILLVHGNSIENVSGDAIHVATSTFAWDLISIVGNQIGNYSNTTGNAIEVTCANLGEVEGLVIAANNFRQSGGATPVAISLTKVHDIRLVGNIYESGFAGGHISASGCTSLVDLDLLDATPSGELGGTWDAITVDTTHSGSSHSSVQAAAEAYTDAAIAALEGIGPIVISDSPSTPLVFADLIQNEAQDDLVYSDL